MPLTPQQGKQPPTPQNPNPTGDWNTVPSYVPGPLVTLVRWAAGVVGLPAAVVAAQWQLESDFNDNALSPTGAQGLTQIEPGTWQSARCNGNPNNANDSAKCYSAIMYGLVQQYHGDIRKALAAYNAGPGNLEAGYGYADQILSNAGFAQNTGASQGTGKPGAGEPGSSSSSSSAGSSGCQVPDCIWGCIPSVSILGATVWQGECLVTYKQAREAIGAAVLVAGVLVMGWGAQLLVGVAALGVATKVVGPVADQVGGAKATVGKVRGLFGVDQRKADQKAEQRERRELEARGASDISQARRPIRREIAEGRRPAPRPGRVTGSVPGPGRESGRQRAVRAASTGRRPATRAEAGF